MLWEACWPMAHFSWKNHHFVPKVQLQLIQSQRFSLDRTDFQHRLGKSSLSTMCLCTPWGSVSAWVADTYLCLGSIGYIAWGASSRPFRMKNELQRFMKFLCFNLTSKHIPAALYTLYLHVRLALYAEWHLSPSFGNAEPHHQPF